MENGRFQIARRAWHEQATSWERRCASGTVDIPDDTLGWAGAPRLSSLELEERFGDGQYDERVKLLDRVLEDPVFEDEDEQVQKEVFDVVRWARGRAIYSAMWKRGVRENRDKLEAKRNNGRALHAKRKRFVEQLVDPTLLEDPSAHAAAHHLATEMVRRYPELVLDDIRWNGAPVVKLESRGDPLNPIVKRAREQLLDLDLNEDLVSSLVSACVTLK